MGKADVAGARERFPLIDASPDELLRRMEQDPVIAYRILYDMVDTFRAADERKLGHRRIGRRVKVKIARDQLVEEAVGPAPSMDPFPVAMKVLMNGRSQVRYARLMGISQSHLSKLLNGLREPDREIMELAAAAGRVPPWFFVEWRVLYVAEWVATVLERHPNISLNIISNIPTPEYKAVL